MAHISPFQAVSLIKGGISNYMTDCPMVVSYELTLSCNCNRLHCDLGGPVMEAVSADHRKAQRL